MPGGGHGNPGGGGGRCRGGGGAPLARRPVEAAADAGGYGGAGAAACEGPPWPLGRPEVGCSAMRAARAGCMPPSAPVTEEAAQCGSLAVLSRVRSRGCCVATPTVRGTASLAPVSSISTSDSESLWATATATCMCSPLSSCCPGDGGVSPPMVGEGGVRGPMVGDGGVRGPMVGDGGVRGPMVGEGGVRGPMVGDGGVRGPSGATAGTCAGRCARMTLKSGRGASGVLGIMAATMLDSPADPDGAPLVALQGRAGNEQGQIECKR